MAPLQPLVETLRRDNLLTSRQLRDLDRVAQEFASVDAFLHELEQRDWLTEYQTRQLRDGLGDRLVIAPYVVLEPLGDGGMGQIFRARHRLLERPAALKRIHPDHQSDPIMAERFLREVRAAAALSHPNIVTVYDFYQQGDKFYLAMEIIPGMDLRTYIKRHGPLPITLVCDYTHQACLGLQHAHGRGVIHRDIKPSNLIVSPDGQLKIIDFGLARRDTDTTITTQAMGTLDYIAPEQAVHAHAVDGRADIYSLGCTLYHLLAGRTPFAHIPADQRVNAHQTREPPRVEQFRPDVPRPLAAVLRRMMERRREDRYQRAVEVAEALGGVGAAMRSEPRRIEITVPGAWLARPENQPDEKKWRPIMATPATVTIRPEEVYYLVVRGDATDAALAGLVRLKGLTVVQSLSLTSCARLTDDVLAHVGGLTGLRSLNMSYCEQVTDNGLAYLRGLTALEILDLSLCRAVTSAGFAHLRGLTALQALDLGGCAQLDGTGLAHLRGFTALQTLNLSRCERVTDEVLEHLHHLTALCRLSLTGCTQLTRAGLERLRRALPRCDIVVN